MTTQELKSHIAVNQQGNSLSYVLGLYFGDGNTHWHSHVNNAFGLQVQDKDFYDNALQQCKLAFPGCSYTQSQYLKSDNVHKQYWFRINYVGMFLDSVTNNDTFIPAFVYESKENVKAFLEALMDSDGFVTDITHLKKGYIFLQFGIATTHIITPEVAKLFNSYGIKTGKIVRKKLQSGKICQHLHINAHDWMMSDLVFSCWRKQRKVEAHKLARNILNVVKQVKDKEAFRDYRQCVLDALRQDEDIVQAA